MTGRCTSLCSFQALPALCNAFRIEPRLLRRHLATQVSQEVRDVTSDAHGGPLSATQAWKRRKTLGPGNAEVYVDSLHDTLDAHRLKNRVSVIRKVAFPSRPGPNPEALPPPANDSPTLGRPSYTRHSFIRSLEESHEILRANWIRRHLQFEAVEKLQAQGLVPEARTLLKGIPSVTEYVGLSFNPLYQHRIFCEIGGEPIEQLPWLKQLDWTCGDALSRLHSEIKSFEIYMSPTAQEKACREALVRDLRAAVGEGMPGFSLKGFGSYMTGLYTSNSDIDLFLIGPVDLNAHGTRSKRTRRSTVLQSKADLEVLANILGELGIYQNIHILNARIPILTGRPKDRSELSFQIATQPDSYLADEYVKKYLAEYPSLRPLFFVLKNMLWTRGFSSPFSGGLGSYPLAIAIVAWLKISKTSDVHMGPRIDESLGEKLLGLLKFYGEFKLYRHGLSVEPSGKFWKRSSYGKPSISEKEAIAEDLTLRGQSKICVINNQQPYLLCLQDPADPFNDLGRRCCGIKHIQQTFNHIYQELKKRMEIFEQDPNRFEKSGLLAPAIVGSYSGIRKRIAQESSIRYMS